MSQNRRSDVLVVEISGKRPGDVKARPTERYTCSYDKVIISNNSEGYVTDWPIVNVPDEYKEWYVNNIKSSDNAWYAPMNRSYAIKYAREHGYKYLIQLDDNILLLEVAYLDKGTNKKIQRRYRATNQEGMMDDFIDALVTVTENTNAVMAGLDLAGVSIPQMSFLSERFVYSFFCLDLDYCPDLFQGDFEDDVEFRLKCFQMGKPSIQIVPLRYGKTGQGKNTDLTGCRAEYAKAGIKRGEHMLKINGDIYSCGLRNKRHGVMAQVEDTAYFHHKLKVFKLGIQVKNQQAIDDKMSEIFKKYAKTEDKCIIKEKKVKAVTNNAKASDRT